MHYPPFSTLWVSLLLIARAGAAILPRATSPILTDVWRFPNGTWAENLAIRSNGQLLVTFLTPPDLYLVDPVDTRNTQLVHQFPGVTALTGIAEVGKDVFAVVAGNFTRETFTSVAGSYSVWKVDMRPCTTGSPAKITKIADIPEAAFLNGMTALDTKRVLIADAGAGVVWRLDTNSGDHQIVIDDPLMKPAQGAPVMLGVNGLGIRKGVLYFTNTFRFTFNRVPIRSDGTATDAAKVIVQNGLGDDFTFDAAGNTFLTQNPLNTLQKITPNGVVTVVVGNPNSTELVGPTSVKFGRTSQDKSTLYVTTSGGLAGPVNGTYTEGAKVVAIDMRGLV